VVRRATSTSDTRAAQAALDRRRKAQRRAEIAALLRESRELLRRSIKARRDAERALRTANELAHAIREREQQRALERTEEALKIAKAQAPVVDLPGYQRPKAS
jgi:hypothetical protein